MFMRQLHDSNSNKKKLAERIRPTTSHIPCEANSGFGGFKDWSAAMKSRRFFLEPNCHRRSFRLKIELVKRSFEKLPISLGCLHSFAFAF